MIANKKIRYFHINFRRLTSKTDFTDKKGPIKKTKKKTKNKPPPPKKTKLLKNGLYPPQYECILLSLRLINKIKINMLRRLGFEDKRNIVISE